MFDISTVYQWLILLTAQFVEEVGALMHEHGEEADKKSYPLARLV